MKQPNIIFFLTDQQRWDSMGLHGNPLELTPNLDRLAMEHTHLFTCLTPQPVCGPARACLQTGMYASATGCVKNGIPLPDHVPTLGQCFRSAGYDTAYIGKWHLAGEDNGVGPVPPEKRGGYDYWLAADVLEMTSEPYGCVVYDGDNQRVFLPGYRVDALTEAAIRYVARERQRPFFLFMSLLEPHHQNRTDDYPAPHGYRERYQGRWTPPDLQALGGTSSRHLGGYWGMVRRIDEAYGRLHDALDSLGLSQDTIVVFTSDHGCHFKTRNAEYKRSCHEASTRVPGVIVGPGFRGGGRIQEPVSLLDLPPTLLDAAGIAIPRTMQGNSLMPRLRERQPGLPGEAFFQISESIMGRGIRTSRWKYAVTAKGSSPNAISAGKYVETELYDLEIDPYELDNLVGVAAYEPVMDILRQRLLARMKGAGEPEADIQPALRDSKAVQREVLPEEMRELREETDWGLPLESGAR